MWLSPRQLTRRDAMEQPIADAAQSLIDEDGAETLILVGAAGAGMPAIIQARVSVPLLDGIACGTVLLEALIKLGAPAPTSGSYASPKGNEISGLGPALTKLLQH